MTTQISCTAWPSLVPGAMDISTDPSTVEPQTHCSPGLGMDATMAPGDSVVYSNLYDLWQHDPQVPIWLLVS